MTAKKTGAIATLVMLAVSYGSPVAALALDHDHGEHTAVAETGMDHEGMGPATDPVRSAEDAAPPFEHTTHAPEHTAPEAMPAFPPQQEASGPSHAGYDPNAPTGRHLHEGEIGEKLLVVERALKCNCSCTLDVHSCQFQMQCAVSPGWSDRIRQSLEAGEGEEAILAGFVADYGGTVLMMPPAEGFNLLGYLLPAFMIVSAGMVAGLLARGRSMSAELARVEDPTDEQSARLKEEMRRIEEWEGPDW